MKRSDRFLQALRPYDDVVVVMHDNPDPDAIASGWAIKHLVEERQGQRVRLVGGGAIVRAENRHMVKLLDPPLEMLDKLHVDNRVAVVLVDCGPQAANFLPGSDGTTPDIIAVIDHHQSNVANRNRLPFEDLRPRVAASATIAAGYLREQQMPPNVYLATALVYAMRSETRGHQTRFCSADRSILSWLQRYADPQMLAEIESAPLSRDYYGDLVLALQNTFTYDNAAFCLLPRAEGAEIIGEVADLLIRCEEIQRVFCGAVVGNDIIVSVRTGPAGGNAAELVRTTLAKLGRGGGHAHRAGGKVAEGASGDRVSDELHEELRKRWLEACHVDRQRGKRLVRRGEIVKHL